MKTIYFCIKSVGFWNLPTETDYLDLHSGEVDNFLPLRWSFQDLYWRHSSLRRLFFCPLTPFVLHCCVWISCFHPAVLCSFIWGVRLCLKGESMKSEDLSSDASPALNLLCVMLSKLHNLIVSFLSCIHLGTGMPVRWACTVIVIVPPNPTIWPESKCYIKISLLTSQVCKKHLLSSWKQILCKVCSQFIPHPQFEIQKL